jgi:hypothetical protein
MVGAQEVGDLAELGIVGDEKKGVDLIVLEGEDLQDRLGLGPVELPEIVDLACVLQMLGQSVGCPLGPERGGGEDQVGPDSPQGEIGSDGPQVVEAAGGEVPFEVARAGFAPVGLGVADQVESFDGSSFGDQRSPSSLEIFLAALSMIILARATLPSSRKMAKTLILAKLSSLCSPALLIRKTCPSRVLASMEAASLKPTSREDSLIIRKASLKMLAE